MLKIEKGRVGVFWGKEEGIYPFQVNAESVAEFLECECLKLFCKHSVGLKKGTDSPL